ncbi:MAG: hypothetical protein U0694_23340 [Anaerolineae bacterium]
MRWPASPYLATTVRHRDDSKIRAFRDQVLVHVRNKPLVDA